MIYLIAGVFYFLVGSIAVFSKFEGFVYRVLLFHLINVLIWPMELFGKATYFSMIRVSYLNGRYAIPIFNGEALGLFSRKEDFPLEDFQKAVMADLPKLMEHRYASKEK